MSIKNEPTFWIPSNKRRTFSSSSSSLSKDISPIREKHSKHRRRHEDQRNYHYNDYKKKKYHRYDRSPEDSDVSSDFSESIRFLHKSKSKTPYCQQRASPSYEPYQHSTLLPSNSDNKKSSKVRHVSSRSPHGHHRRESKTSSLHKSVKHKKERLLRPETSVLAMIIKDQVRTNDRMDREEVKRATLALRELDPTTTDQARLMTEYLASACSKRL